MSFNTLTPGKLYCVRTPDVHVHSIENIGQTAIWLKRNHPYMLTRIAPWDGDYSGARYYFLIDKKEYVKYVIYEHLHMFHEYTDNV